MGKPQRHHHSIESLRKDGVKGTLLQEITYYCVQKSDGKKVSRFECSNNIRRLSPCSPIKETIVLNNASKQKEAKSSPSPTALQSSSGTNHNSHTSGKKSHLKRQKQKKKGFSTISLCDRCRSCSCSSVMNGLCRLPSRIGAVRSLSENFCWQH